MSPRPTITVAIPYYSGRAYLAEAIASVQAQTERNWRLLVVDDAGPEPADELVASYGDERMTYVRNDVNRGLAGNWNECVRLARTELVTLLHADDRLRPGYVAAVLEAAESEPEVAALMTDVEIIGDDGRPSRSLPDWVKRRARRLPVDHVLGGDRDLAGILSNNYVFCPTLCYRREIVGAEPFDEHWKMVMDLDLVAHLLLHGRELAALREPLYEYRRHRANATNALTASAVRFEEEIALYRELAVEAASQGWTRTAKAARRRRMVRAHLALRATVDLVSGRMSAARAKARLLREDLRRRT